MSIQRLPIFLSAAEHLNFTKAAEEHHISQTAVSQQIKEMDDMIEILLRMAYTMIEEADPSQVENYEKFLKDADGIFEDQQWKVVLVLQRLWRC